MFNVIKPASERVFLWLRITFLAVAVICSLLNYSTRVICVSRQMKG